MSTTLVPPKRSLARGVKRKCRLAYLRLQRFQNIFDILYCVWIIIYIHTFLNDMHTTIIVKCLTINICWFSFNWYLNTTTTTNLFGMILQRLWVTILMILTSLVFKFSMLNWFIAPLFRTILNNKINEEEIKILALVTTIRFFTSLKFT